METEVTGPDAYGNEAYKKLFEALMGEMGKALSLDRAKIFLDPARPLFIFTIVMRTEPESKTIADAASIRTEGSDVHITISDENYAPEILSALWRIYGRDSVDQQTRFDIKIGNGDDERIAGTEITSGEDAKQEIIGAMWRILPEGIKARHNISEGRIITIAATEEIFTQELKDIALRMHSEVRDSANV
ncbi:MAG: methanogenesis marker 17 protein [Methanomassiliicoccaceae archaeon]|jgi:putative methanogenesis marker protein 17|nr:methanogenesis marker 17 protein [Methanomassiliicoccaceae archaeon]